MECMSVVNVVDKIVPEFFNRFMVWFVTSPICFLREMFRFFDKKLCRLFNQDSAFLIKMGQSLTNSAACPISSKSNPPNTKISSSKQILMEMTRGNPRRSSHAQMGSSNMAKIIPKDKRISKSCSKYNPKMTNAMEIRTAARRIE